MLDLVLDILRAHDNGPLSRARLQAGGFTAEGAAEARALEWRRQVVAELVPGMTPAARESAAEAALGDGDVTRLATFWKALEAQLADDGPERSGWIALDRESDGTRVVVTKGRQNVTPAWQAPTLIIDAVLQTELVRWYFPQVQVVADLAVEAPHQRVRQVTDRAYAKSMLEPLDPEKAAVDPDEANCRTRNLGKIRVQLINCAHRVAPRRVLVVLQKAAESALLKLGPLPANVETAHHNAIAGRDQWRDVAMLVLVGRTMPPPGVVARMAEALSGAAVPLMEGWYQRSDATRETLDGTETAEADRYPNPLAEAIRWAVCEGELVQIIGRGRGVNRTADDPLDVLVMCDVPLPLPVAETLPAAALDPSLAEWMLAAGGAVLENPAHAARAYPGMWRSERAAAKAFERARTATFPYKRFIIGECRTPPVHVTYQLMGAGQKPATAWFNPLVVPNPAAWLAERLGMLAWCTR